MTLKWFCLVVAFRLVPPFLFHRSDPFSEDLLPTVVPPLLDGLPDEDAMSDEEQ